jgi:hypothetical protein
MIFCVLQERASGMYRLSAFYFARLASDLPMDMAIPTVRPPRHRTIRMPLLDV